MKKTIGLMIALLFALSAFSQTKTEIKPADLPKGVSAYITKNFSGYMVDKAFKVDNKGVMSTEVMVGRGSEKLALTFDKDIKLTKKEAMKPDMKNLTPREEKKATSPVREGKMSDPVKK